MLFFPGLHQPADTRYFVKLRYRNDKERQAVAWFKRVQRRGLWLQKAVETHAYDPFFKKNPQIVGLGMQVISRAQWIRWESRPYGNSDMNAKHQLAKLCIRRAVFFPDLPCAREGQR
jgi:hypothetical protein